ncbi:hypothetical protein ACIBCH_14795 [Amycolatopsis thailandensis]|uniref:hypothetical protein n=1 Tax=Amycolatopsis thailandensis TaxID=589330 RepID=UPI0037B30922
MISDYLWSAGIKETSSRGLKDTVSRALSGKLLSTRTLRWFISAFEMSDSHAAELLALRSGGDPGRLSIIRPAGIVTERPKPRQRYRTISLCDHHVVGADGLPVQHRTLHVVRAIDELSCYCYQFDTDAASVEVVRGGTAGPLYRTDVDGIFAVDITFHEPVRPGKTASFEYRTLLDYQQPPRPEFRRAASYLIANVTLDVYFDPAHLPSKIWWAEWDSLSSCRPAHEEPIALRADGSVHRHVDNLQGIVGYHWEFPAASQSREA